MSIHTQAQTHTSEKAQHQQFTYKFICRSYALTRPKSLWLFRTFTRICVLPRTALYNTLNGPDFRSVVSVCSPCAGSLIVAVLQFICSFSLLDRTTEQQQKEQSRVVFCCGNKVKQTTMLDAVPSVAGDVAAYRYFLPASKTREPLQ